MNQTREIMEGVLKGIDGILQSKTVVGEPIQVGETTLIPLMEVSMGMGAGAFDKNKSDSKNDGKGKQGSVSQSGAAALSSKIAPTAILLLKGNKCKLINIKNQDMMTKILDMVPDLVDKITGKSRVSEEAEEKAQAILDSAKGEIIVEDLEEGLL